MNAAPYLARTVADRRIGLVRLIRAAWLRWSLVQVEAELAETRRGLRSVNRLAPEERQVLHLAVSNLRRERDGLRDRLREVSGR